MLGVTQDLLACEEEREEKICRICLENEEDDPSSPLIAPCRCKGSSKWVHRHCLDQWRTNREDRAFSRCTECLFDYHMEVDRDGDRRRRLKFRLHVIRDLVGFTLLVQAVIIICAWFIALIDHFHSIPGGLGCKYIDESNITNQNMTMDDVDRDPIHANYPFCHYGTYYATGLVVMFVLLGIYGSIVLCQHNCSVQDAMSHSDLGGAQIPTAGTMTGRGGVGDNHHGGSYARNRPSSSCPYGCYIIDCTGCNCDCCCPSDGCPHTGGVGGGNHDGAPILLLILAVVAAILAIIGAVVGFIIAVSITQRVIQRHMFRLHKRRLVSEYRVVDLATCDRYRDEPSAGKTADLEQPNLPPSLDSVEPLPPPPTTKPSLPELDVVHLKSLGLMD